MVRKVANLDFCRFEFCCGRESRICIRPLHTKEVSQFKNAVVASTSRTDMYPDSRSSGFDDCRWGSLALVRAVHSRPAVVRE